MKRPWVSLTVVYAAAVSGCFTVSGQSPDAGSGSSQADAGPSLDAVDVPIVTAPTSDAGPSLPPGFFAPPQPEVRCDEADGGAAACDIPPSVCADSSSCDGGWEACQPVWFIYYENPRCVAGRCVWDQAVFHCTRSFYYCVAGACVYESPTN